MRPTRHRLHLAPELDDLGVCCWPGAARPRRHAHALANGERFRGVATVEVEPGFAIDRLLEVAPAADPQPSRR